MWTITIHRRVEKRLSLLSKDERDRILRAIHALRHTPFEHDLKPLKGSPLWRLRVGGWRVLLEIDRGRLVIAALALGSRGDIYKK